MIDTQLPGALDEDLPGPSDSQPLPLGGDGIQFATPGPDDVQPVLNETLNRVLTALITIGPMARARLGGLADVGRIAAPRAT